MNNIKRTVSRLQWRVVPIIFAGILLFLLTLDLSGRNGLSRTQALEELADPRYGQSVQKYTPRPVAQDGGHRRL